MSKSKIYLSQLGKVIPFKWRVQSVSKEKPTASCVAYIDSRSVQALLDEVVGPENWQSDYKEIKGNLYAGIGIFYNDKWVWKWDCGTESVSDKEKGEASDSFKRAAVKWQIGRWLYDMPIQYLTTNERYYKQDNGYWNKPYPIDNNGKRIWDITPILNAHPKVKDFIKKHDLKVDISKDAPPEPKFLENGINVTEAKKPANRTNPSQKVKLEDGTVDGAIDFLTKSSSLNQLELRKQKSIEKYPDLKKHERFIKAENETRTKLEAKGMGL